MMAVIANGIAIKAALVAVLAEFFALRSSACEALLRRRDSFI
jgi:hypothetical protein